MRKGVLVFSTAIWVLAIQSCVQLHTAPPSTPHQVPVSQTVAPKSVRMHVFSHGWHTGVIFAHKDLAALRQQPWISELHPAKAKYLEFGWGDEAAYRAKTIGAKQIITALLIPTKTVVHLERFSESPYQHYKHSQLVTFDITPKHLAAMMQRIKKSLKKDRAGKIVSIGDGVEADSEFFRARKYYFITRSCNLWTSSVLKAGGIKVRATLAPKLMQQLSSAVTPAK